MPVVLRLKGYKFWFYEVDLVEPPHIHVGKSGKQAKYWLDPISLARAGRFRGHELDEIEKILEEYRSELLESWQKEKRKHVNG